MISRSTHVIHDKSTQNDTLNEIRSALRNGSTLNEIARQLGMDTAELRRVLGEPLGAEDPSCSPGV